jgi:ArsR family transcriptional regulator
MPISKLAAFSTDENELAELAKALGHPARIAILKELARHDMCVCGEIVEVLPLAQSTVSQHLKELKEAGLICGTVEGVKSCYCINRETLRHLHNLIGAFLQVTPSTPDASSCCG